MTTRELALRTDEAVELGHAYVQAVSARHSIRVLFIKGPSLDRLGLRNNHVSSDVDALVDPTRFQDLLDALLTSGWQRRPTRLSERVSARHAVTLIHPQWPCDIDLHHSFPGFLLSPERVFSALWEDRIELPFAHQLCAVPSRAGSTLVFALHLLRNGMRGERDRQSFAVLTSAVLPDNERQALALLAQSTGCTSTLRDFLSALRVTADPPEDEATSLALREWRASVKAGSHGAYHWVTAIRAARPSERPQLLARAVWPSRADLATKWPSRPLGPMRRVAVRLARLGGGLRHLPVAVAAIFPYRTRD